MSNMINYKPCTLYDHSIILVRSKTSLNLYSVSSETPSGIVNNSNKSFIFLNDNVVKNSVSITVDGSQTPITDDGQGNLSDGGTIEYSTGIFTLDSQPQSTLIQNYEYSTDNVFIDDLMNREIVFNNNNFKLYLKNQNGNRLVEYGQLKDNSTTQDNVWSQVKQKNEMIKYSLIF